MSKTVEKNIARIIYLTVVSIFLMVLIHPFIIPIILAASVALAMYPVQCRLEGKLGRRPTAALLTIFFALVISIPLMFFVIKGVSAITLQLEQISLAEIQKEGVSSFVSGLQSDLVASIHRLGAKFNADDFLTHSKINDYLKQATVILLNFFRSFLSSIPVVVLFLLVTIACTYSFLKNAENVRNMFQHLFAFSDEKMDTLVKIFINGSRQVYISNLLTGGLQSLVVATGAAIMGVGDFFLVFFITIILAFVPVIGAAPVAFVAAGIAFIQGNTTATIVMVAVGAFAGVVDNFLRPWLASFGESKTPPIIAFVCVLGGAILLGFPGLFIGLLLASVAYETLPFFWHELGKSRGSQSQTEVLE